MVGRQAIVLILLALVCLCARGEHEGPQVAATAVEPLSRPVLTGPAAPRYKRLPKYYNIVRPMDGKGAPAAFGQLEKIGEDIQPGIAVYKHPYNGNWTPNGGYGYNNRGGVDPKNDLIVVAEDLQTGKFVAGYIPRKKVEVLKSKTPEQILKIINGDGDGDDKGDVRAPLSLYPPDSTSDYGTASLGTRAELHVDGVALSWQIWNFRGIAAEVGMSPLYSDNLKESLHYLDQVTRMAQTTEAMGAAILSPEAFSPPPPTGIPNNSAFAPPQPRFRLLDTESR